MIEPCTVIDPSTITPGVRRLVAFMRKHGFQTTDSGDGITNPEVRMECAFPQPNVFIDVPDLSRAFAETNRLYALLTAEGQDFGPDSPTVIHCQYDPVDGLAMIYVMGVDDAMVWGQSETLERDRLEFQIAHVKDFIANPPVDKMRGEDVEAAVDDHLVMLSELEDRLSALVAKDG